MSTMLSWLISPFTKAFLFMLLGAAAAAVLYIYVKHRKAIRRQSRMLGARLRDIGELAVEEAHCTLVHCTKEPRRLLGKDLPLMRERCIFTIDAVVKIGFDFDQIVVHIDDIRKHITLRLPPLRILSTSIQYESMKLFDEKTGVFARPRVEWYNDSMLHLAQEAEEKAKEFGALERAKSSAKLRLEAFVGKLCDLTEYTLDMYFSYPPQPPVARPTTPAQVEAPSAEETPVA